MVMSNQKTLDTPTLSEQHSLISQWGLVKAKAIISSVLAQVLFEQKLEVIYWFSDANSTSDIPLSLWIYRTEFYFSCLGREEVLCGAFSVTLQEKQMCRFNEWWLCTRFKSNLPESNICILCKLYDLDEPIILTSHSFTISSISRSQNNRRTWNWVTITECECLTFSRFSLIYFSPFVSLIHTYTQARKSTQRQLESSQTTNAKG